MKSYHFPFSAILGQERMKLALLLNVIDPKIGGVLLTGHQGTGKSTAVRSLMEILFPIEVHKGCQFNCNIHDPEKYCDWCRSESKEIIKKPISLITLPLGATQEMVVGSLDLEKIIREGKRAIQPGLLAKAHRGILYIDEINLLQDHLVDVLLDVSASGINIIEREGISLSHPANFILIGSMNPEEGELRPQISDRLGLEVQIRAPTNPEIRAEITQRVITYQDNPKEFCQQYESEQNSLMQQILKAKEQIQEVSIPDELFLKASQLVLKLELYSQRADITFLRCARAHAAFLHHGEILEDDLKNAMYLVFQHRLSESHATLDESLLDNAFEEIFKEGVNNNPKEDSKDGAI